MKKIVIVFVVLMISTVAAFAFLLNTKSTTPESALLAMEKLRSRLGVGISLQEYLGQVSELKFKVEQYLKEHNQENEFNNSLKKGLNLYLAAAEAWNFSVKHEESVKVQNHRFLMDFFQMYPEAKKEYYNNNGLEIEGRDTISLMQLVEVDWNMAGKYCKEASNSIDKVKHWWSW